MQRCHRPGGVVGAGSQHGLHQVVPPVLFKEPLFQAARDERQHVGLHVFADGHRLYLSRGANGGAEIEADVVFDQDLHHPQRGTAQGEGVGGCFGLQPDGEQAHQAIEAVRQRQHDAGFAGGQFIAGVAGQGVFENGIGNGGAFATVQGVVAPHDARQRGKFDHHLRHKVGFAEVGGALGNGALVSVQPQHVGEERRQAFNALVLVEHGAEFCLEGEPAQFGAEGFQRLGDVVFPEESGVGVAGTDDGFVARPHGGNVHTPVGDGDEVGQEVALGVFHREIALVLAHDGHQHFTRQAEILFFKRTAQGHRRFVEVGDFIKQVAFGFFGHAPAHFGGEGLGGFPDGFAALVHVQHDAVRGERAFVHVGAGDVEGLRLGAAHVARGAPAHHTGVLERNHLFAQQRHNPAQGAGVGDVSPVPAHALGEGDAGNERGQGFGEHVAGGATFFTHMGDNVFAPVYLAPFEGAHVHALRAGKAQGGFGGVPLGVECDACGGTFHHFFFIALARRHAFDNHGETARRSFDAHALVVQAQVAEQCGNTLAQLRHRQRHVIGGQFFGADFQHEGLRFVQHPGGARRHFDVRRGDGTQREAHFLALFKPQTRHVAGEVAHALEVALTFGHANRAARVQNVEGVRCFEHVGIGGNGQALFDEHFGFGFVEVEELRHPLDVGGVEVVDAHLVFVLPQHFIVGDARRVDDFLEVVYPLQRHDDAFQPVGDFHRHGVQVEAARLLEVGELRDFQPIQPDFPAQPPSAQRGRFPVVFDKAHVVFAQVNAQRFQASQVEFLRVAGVGFEDDLVLRVHLDAVGVFAVAAIVGAHARLDVADVPRFGSQHAQEGGGVHCARADFGVVGLPQQTPGFRPVVLQAQNHVLEGELVAHGLPLCFGLGSFGWGKGYAMWGRRQGVVNG